MGSVVHDERACRFVMSGRTGAFLEYAVGSDGSLDL